MPAPHSPVVLLTGASSGLGLAIARQLLETDCRLVLTAREASLPRFASLGIIASDRVRLRALDVTHAAERIAVVREAQERWGGIDALINNAGVAYRTVTEHIDDRAWRQVMEIDCHAPLELARLVLPGMRARRRGHILNVSSVGGMMAMPTMALYSAAKFALEGWSESLWYEVRPWDIRVCLIEPGFIRSDSFHNTLFTRRSLLAVTDDADAYHEHYHHMASFIERLMNRTIATPERIAAKVVATLRNPDPPLRVHATPDAHLFALLRRLLPRGLYHRVLYWSLPHIRLWGPGTGAPANPTVPFPSRPESATSRRG
jgi:short-subunit dehydrogenase